MVNTRTPRRRRRATIAAFGAFITLPAAAALVADGNVTARPETAARTTPAAAPTVGTRVQSIEDRGGLSVLARPGKANVINIALSNTTFTVRDTGDDVVAGPGCESIDAHTARCVAFGQPVRIDTGDLDDTVVAPFPLPTDVSAGFGNDTITTGSAADELRGGLGNDQLTAGAGADLLDGNLGADVMKGQSGRDTLLGVGRADEADVLSGGPDTDIADYSGRDEDLTISLDDVANDGEPGEQDNVRNDVEEIEGGDGGDTLTGSNMVAVTNRLLGGPGGDTLVGRAGPDRMFAQEGNDVLDGGSGNDDLDGGPNADTIIGGPDRDEVLYSSRANRVVVDIDDVADDGETNEKDNVRTDVEDITSGQGSDRLTGSSAANRFSSGSGNDIIDGGLGADLFGGGSGFDRVTYETRTQGVIANIDGVDNDGVGDEKDNITNDVESIIGGSDDDLLGGRDFGDDNLAGGPGNDVLLGFGGNDDLFGDAGIDGLGCGPGEDDFANGGPNNDSSNGCETTVSVEDVTP